MLKGLTILPFFISLTIAYQVPTCTSENEKYADPENVMTYFICVNGLLELRKCENNHLFDTTNLECVDRQQMEISDDANYQCFKHGVYNYVDSDSCHHYYHCDNGVLTIEKCGWFKNFSPTKLECRWFFLVDCYKPPAPTTTPVYTTQTTETSTTTTVTTKPTVPSTVTTETTQSSSTTSSSTTTETTTTTPTTTETTTTTPTTTETTTTTPTTTETTTTTPTTTETTTTAPTTTTTIRTTTHKHHKHHHKHHKKTTKHHKKTTPSLPYNNGTNTN